MDFIGFKLNKFMSSFILKVFGPIVFLLSSLPFAMADSLQSRIQQNTLAAKPIKNGLNITFFGTTSFLFDDGITQILIDGFVSRQKYGPIKHFGPELEDIQNVIREHNFSQNPFRHNNLTTGNICSRPALGLQLVIPAHGHYDHALDASYFAAWAGATLIADTSIQRLYKASEEYTPLKPHELNWNSVKMVEPFEENAPHEKKIECGSFKITLIRSHHLTTPIHLFLGGEIREEFKFPTNIWKMNEGTNLSIHVQHGKKSILIVPSVGLLDGAYDATNLEADIVFLGIGGMGIKNNRTHKQIWDQLVEDTAARRVFPIHWDDDRKHLSKSEKNFAPARPLLVQRTLDILDKFSQNSEIEITFAPANKAFDPYLGVNAN